MCLYNNFCAVLCDSFASGFIFISPFEMSTAEFESDKLQAEL